MGPKIIVIWKPLCIQLSVNHFETFKILIGQHNFHVILSLISPCYSCCSITCPPPSFNATNMFAVFGTVSAVEPMSLRFGLATSTPFKTAKKHQCQSTTSSTQPVRNSLLQQVLQSALPQINHTEGFKGHHYYYIYTCISLPPMIYIKQSIVNWKFYSSLYLYLSRIYRFDLYIVGCYCTFMKLKFYPILCTNCSKCISIWSAFVLFFNCILMFSLKLHKVHWKSFEKKVKLCVSLYLINHVSRLMTHDPRVVMMYFWAFNCRHVKCHLWTHNIYDA